MGDGLRLRARLCISSVDVYGLAGRQRGTQLGHVGAAVVLRSWTLVQWVGGSSLLFFFSDNGGSTLDVSL